MIGDPTSIHDQFVRLSSNVSKIKNSLTSGLGPHTYIHYAQELAKVREDFLINKIRGTTQENTELIKLFNETVNNLSRLAPTNVRSLSSIDYNAPKEILEELLSRNENYRKATPEKKAFQA